MGVSVKTLIEGTRVAAASCGIALLALAGARAGGCDGSISLPAGFAVGKCADYDPRILALEFGSYDPWAECWNLSGSNLQHPACGRSLSISPFLACRADQLAATTARDWRPGDVALLGDSLVDVLRLGRPAILPRVHNMGLAGGEIDTVTYVLDELFLGPQATCPAPSRVLVIISSDDIYAYLCRGLDASDSASMTEYFWQRLDCLFVRLAQLKAAWPECDVVVHTIPPAATGGIWFENGVCPTFFASQFNEIAPEVNAYIVAKAAETGLPVFDLFPLYWDGEGGDVAYFQDNIHQNCDGVRLWIEELVGITYEPLSIGVPLAVAATEPSAPPQFAAFPNKAMEFRYAGLCLAAPYDNGGYRLEFGAQSSVSGGCAPVEWLGIFSPSEGQLLSTIDPSDPGPLPPFSGTTETRFVVAAGFEPGATDREIVAKAAEQIVFAASDGGFRVHPLGSKPLQIGGDTVGNCSASSKGGGPLASHWMAVDVPPTYRLTARPPTGIPTPVVRVGMFRRMIGHDCAGARLDALNCDAVATWQNATTETQTAYVLVNVDTSLPSVGNALQVWLQPPDVLRTRGDGPPRAPKRPRAKPPRP